MADSSHAIIVHNKRMLLHLRDKHIDRNPNKWSLIGGAVESGETDDEALVREMKEEICIAPEDVKYLGKIRTQDGLHAIYYVKLADDEVKDIRLGNEGQKVEFFQVDEIEGLDLAKSLDRYFDKYKDYLAEIIESHEIPDPRRLGLKR